MKPVNLMNHFRKNLDCPINSLFIYQCVIKPHGFNAFSSKGEEEFARDEDHLLLNRLPEYFLHVKTFGSFGPDKHSAFRMCPPEAARKIFLQGMKH